MLCINTHIHIYMCILMKYIYVNIYTYLRPWRLKWAVQYLSVTQLLYMSSCRGPYVSSFSRALYMCVLILTRPIHVCPHTDGLILLDMGPNTQRYWRPNTTIYGSATSECTLKILAYAASSNSCMRPSATSVCGLKPLVSAALSY